MTRQTSIATYRKIEQEGLLSLRRWQVYAVLFDIGPATGGEVFREMRKRYSTAMPTNSNTTTRLGELRNMGVAMELGTKVCEVSGQRVILWDVTAALPDPIKKEKHTEMKCPTCEGTGKIKQGRLF